MKNCMIPAPRGDRRPSPSFGTLRKKLPQANSAVANRTSQGTRRANTAAGVNKRMTAPSAPPTRLITNSVRIVRPGGVSAPARPVKPVTSCAGNSATVDVMLAARASMPVSISDGKVMNEPPPASAFCVPAQIEAMKRMTSAVIPRSRDFASVRSVGGPRFSRSCKILRGAFMLGDQRREVEPDRLAVDDAPVAGDHDAIRPMRAAQNERGERIVRAREARLVERKQRQIRLVTLLDPADVGAPEAARRAFARPAQDVEMGDLVGAVTQAADHQRVAHRLHHVGGIVGRRAVDPQAYGYAGRLELACRANPRGEHHVRRRAMADADIRLAQPRDLVAVEMNAMREPDATRHPARLLQEIDRPQAIHPEAEPLLILGFAQVGMQLAIVALGKPCAFAHEALRDRKRRT